MIIVDRMLYLAIITLILFDCTALKAQGNFEVMFYNVENLFDTLDNPYTIDEDYTPFGKLEYNTERFNNKAANIASVINASVDGGMPEIIGLCEVESTVALDALFSQLNNAKQYTYLTSGTNDRRGIQNALIVHQRFEIIETEVHQVDLKKERPTRPVFCVHLEDIQTKARFWVIVNHWPSRYGGAEESNWKRMAASDVVLKTIATYRKQTSKSSIIVMGDFNDYPSNESLMNLERCKGKKDPCLTSVHKYLHEEGLGTHSYLGEWHIMDQILVSNHFLKDSSNELKITPNSGTIVKHRWMLYENKEFNDFLPSRYFSRDGYFGGYSDHLPVLVKVMTN